MKKAIPFQRPTSYKNLSLFSLFYKKVIIVLSPKPFLAFFFPSHSTTHILVDSSLKKLLVISVWWKLSRTMRSHSNSPSRATVRASFPMDSLPRSLEYWDRIRVEPPRGAASFWPELRLRTRLLISVIPIGNQSSKPISRNALIFLISLISSQMLNPFLPPFASRWGL